MLERRFCPWVGKTPCRRKWQPLQILAGRSCGQRSLAAAAHGITESDTTEQLNQWGSLTHVIHSTRRLRSACLTRDG